jgi:molybdopterin molybdotransferase
VRARELAGSTAQPVPVRELPLAHAAGAVLGADVSARTDLPPADTSAMDGWAVKGPGPWRVRGQLLAGSLAEPLAAGEAVAVATGAWLPPAADGVVRSEHGRVEEHAAADGALPLLVPTDPHDPARDVRRAGCECRAGEVVLPSGVRLTAPAIGLLAAAGADVVPVRRATVDVLVVGDELVTSGPARAGRIRDALGPMLSEWLPALGLELATRRQVPDDAGALDAALAGCAADVVVTTGSTAGGPADHLHQVLARRGARLVVDGVAVRPGHPQVLAVRPDGRPVVGLPGNPLAAATAVLTLLVPLVAGLHAAAPAARRRVRLAEPVAAGPRATRLVPVAEGRPVLFAGPAMLRGLAVADGVAVVPPGGADAGVEVELLPLPS